MRFASALSEQPSTDGALAEIVRTIEAGLGGATPNFLALFASPHHAPSYAAIASALAKRFPSATMLGCTGGGVIGDGREVEERPALSVTAAFMPDVECKVLHLEMDDLPAQYRRLAAETDHVDLAEVREPTAQSDESEDVHAWAASRGLPADPDVELVVLADPFTFDADVLVTLLDKLYPGGVKIGGLASGGLPTTAMAGGSERRGPKGHALFKNGEVHRSGSLLCVLRGNITIDTIVAQGCRPIGRPMIVTHAEDNLIYALDGRPPLEAMQTLFHSLSAPDQDLFRHALSIGVEMNEKSVEHQAGELLVRNVLGIDAERGCLALGTSVARWQVVQFLLRDAKSAAADLRKLLSRYRQSSSDTPAGGLLFSCLGRGTHLYGRPGHDTGLFQDALGPIALGGFFCNGEIGPIRGTTFLHGYTSSFGLFREREPRDAK